jgi:hypothetical protein
MGTGQQIYGCNLHVAHDLHEEEATSSCPNQKFMS